MTNTRLIAIALILFAALAAPAETPVDSPRPGETLYLIVLGDSGKEPDVTAHGGRVLRSWSGRRLVALSTEGLAALRDDKGVASIQRIWTGDGASAEVSTQSFPTPETNAAAPAWSTGIYRYDPSGNVKEIGLDTYAYDSVSRVTGATVQGQAQSFAFDPYGNLQQLGMKIFSVDTGTNRLGGHTYDAAGNVTTDAKGRRYHYDAFGVVTAISLAPTDSVLNDQRMIYTAGDERIVIAEGTNTRYRVRDIGAPVVLREWKSTGAILEWERDYIYAGGDLVAGEVQVGPHRNSLRHYHQDHLGSVRMVTDGARELVGRHDYFPFGAELLPTTTEYDNTTRGPRDPLKFTSHERDYLSVANVDGDVVDYMHARYYAPAVGRFLSVDPALDIKEALPEPQMWNRYSYVTNKPLTFNDPDGRYRTYYKEKSLREADDWDKHPSVSWAFYAEGGLLTLAAGGPTRNAAFEISLLAMRQPGTVLAAMKVLHWLGGNSTRYINTTGLTGQKHGYLLDSASKGNLFRNILGFTEKTIGAGLRSHFAANLKNASIQAKTGNLEVTGPMKGPNGVVWKISTYWQWIEKSKKWEFVSSQPTK